MVLRATDEWFDVAGTLQCQWDGSPLPMQLDTYSMGDGGSHCLQLNLE